jgi:hypothetical protein
MTRTITFDGAQTTLFGTVSLGALADALAPLKLMDADDNGGDTPYDRTVYFDFCALKPTNLDSYRGYYEHLAVGFSEDGDSMTVAALHDLLTRADGKEYEGYKGGVFRMDRDTPVWASNYGRSSSTAIVGLLVESYRVTLLTEYLP